MAGFWNRKENGEGEAIVANAVSGNVPGQPRIYAGLGFDPREEKPRIPSVERLDMGGIIGGDFEELACAKPAHSEPLAVNEVLSETMEKIVSKASDGTFDHQAVPIIEAWIEEIAALADLQLQKEGLRAETVMRAKRAADAARKAVADERRAREDDLRRRCKVV